MIGQIDKALTDEIGTLADLLRISDDLARRISGARHQHRFETSELVEDAAITSQVIIKKEREAAAGNGGTAGIATTGDDRHYSTAPQHAPHQSCALPRSTLP